MEKRRRIRLSKTMSYLLRHHPERSDLVLDPEGFVPLKDLVSSLKSIAGFRELGKEEVMEVVELCDKMRFEVRDREIRACYGHSVPGRIEHERRRPPEVLFHGTVRRYLGRIMDRGLLPMGRQYVHLTAERDLAETVGGRRGADVVVLEVRAKKAHESGIPFFRANPRFYLADRVPARFLIET